MENITAISEALVRANQRNLKKVFKKKWKKVSVSDGYSYAVRDKKTDKWYTNFYSQESYHIWYCPKVKTKSNLISVGLAVLSKIQQKVEIKYKNQAKGIYN